MGNIRDQKHFRCKKISALKGIFYLYLLLRSKYICNLSGFSVLEKFRFAGVVLLRKKDVFLLIYWNWNLCYLKITQWLQSPKININNSLPTILLYIIIIAKKIEKHILSHRVFLWSTAVNREEKNFNRFILIWAVTCEFTLTNVSERIPSPSPCTISSLHLFITRKLVLYNSWLDTIPLSHLVLTVQKNNKSSLTNDSNVFVVKL